MQVRSLLYLRDAETGGAESRVSEIEGVGARTRDLSIKSALLYQLSYTPISFAKKDNSQKINNIILKSQNLQGGEW